MKTSLVFFGFLLGLLASVMFQLVTRPRGAPVPSHIVDQLGDLERGFALKAPLYISWDEETKSLVGLRQSGIPGFGVRARYYLRFSPFTGLPLFQREIHGDEKPQGKTLEELGASKAK